MKYVVLLRGVNVGGNNRVPKAEFKQVLEGLGLRDVIIYINSGNAILTNIPRRNQSRYSLLKVIGTPPYKQITVRNITTARKLAELVHA